MDSKCNVNRGFGTLSEVTARGRHRSQCVIDGISLERDVCSKYILFDIGEVCDPFQWWSSVVDVPPWLAAITYLCPDIITALVTGIAVTCHA